MTNFFINNINNNLFIFTDNKKLKIASKVNKALKHLSSSKIWTIYIVMNEVLFDQWKIIRNIGNIVFLVSDNFTYTLKHLASLNAVTSSSIVLSNNIFEAYLSSYINVYKLRNKKIVLLDYEDFLSKRDFTLDTSSLINDYIFLQEKNEEDSLWHKKTKDLLLEYNGIEWLIANIDAITNTRTKEIIKYQEQKIGFYIQLKKMFITSNNITIDE